MRRYFILFALLMSVLSSGAYDFEAKGLLFRITDRQKRTVEVTHWDEWTGMNGVPDHYRPDLCHAHHHDSSHVHDANCGHEKEHIPVIPSFPDTIVVPAKVWHKGKRYTVTAVGDGSFYCRKNIRLVRLPKTIKRIGQSAFRGCARLYQVEWHAGIDTIGAYAFYMDNFLETLVLPDSLKYIGRYAFALCGGLREVCMPASLLCFEGNAFLRSNQLKRIVMNQKTPPRVINTGIKMDFKDVFFVIPEESRPVYQQDRFWKQQNY